jgi:nitrogen PTS system EIIA component
MTNLSKILPRSNIVLDLDVSSKQSAFEQVSELLENNCSIARSVVLENLLAREALGSTGLGHGVAVPHGRIKGLKAVMAAFVRLKEPIPFDSPDGRPVKLLIVVLIPDNVTQQHLEILSEVAEIFSNEAFRAMLATEPIPDLIHERIVSWKPGQRAA